MYLIVGLGNPGRRYERTRHNAGFVVLDEVASRWRSDFQPGKGDYWYLQADRRDTPVVLLKPTTFMNDSGHAVADAAAFFSVGPENIVVVYDDVHLPVGSLRIRPRGSDGGHNGMYSVISRMETDEIPRIRCGIGSPALPEDPALLRSFVLDVFDDSERPVVASMIVRAADAVELLVSDGITAAMNAFNGSPSTDL